MAFDWKLTPPKSVKIEVSHWGTDGNGNTTARFFIRWNNGKAGDARETGNYRAGRGVQTGVGDHTSEGAILKLAGLFPGTCWAIAGTIDGSRAEGFASFEAVRDYESEPVPVIFRAERSGDFKGEVTAVFPTLPGTDDSDVTIYAHIGQHGTGARGWYRETRPATEAEAAPLKKELESAPFRYRVLPVKRWTGQHDAKRAAIYRASREAI